MSPNHCNRLHLGRQVITKRRFASETAQSGLVASGAGWSGGVAFGTVSPDVGAFDLGAVSFEDGVFVAVPLGGVAFCAFGVCVPWEKAGAAIERDKSRRTTESSLRITNPFMAMGVVMPGVSQACTGIDTAGGLGGATAGDRASVVFRFLIDVT